MSGLSYDSRFKEFELKTTLDKDEILDTIRANFDPEEVFDVTDLEYWAKHNGFVVEEEV